MRKIRQKQIAVIVEWTNNYARQFIEGVAKFAADYPSWSLHLHNPGGIAQLKLTPYDGFICRLPDRAAGRRLARLGRPVVEAAMLMKESREFVTVGSNITSRSKLAADHFLQRRFTNFAYCGFGDLRYSIQQGEDFARFVRQAGFETHAYVMPNAAKRKFREVQHLLSPVEIPDAHSLRMWLEKLPKPVALFCCNDRRAFQAASLCREAKIQVPKEIAILGVDNDPMYGEFSSPRLSSVDPDAMGVGYTAAATLAGMLGEHGFLPRKPGEIVMHEPKGIVDRGSTHVFPLEPDWLADALLFIHQHVSDNLTASDVFDYAKRSHNTVDRTFRRKLGTTVQKEIAKTRLDTAKQLLMRGDLSMIKIAQMSGFSSAEYFCRSFTSTFGISPTKFQSAQSTMPRIIQNA